MIGAGAIVALVLLTYFLVIALFFVLSIVLTDFKGFKRADIKKRGWDSLRAGKFWMAMAVAAVFTLIAGGVSGFSGGASSSLNFNYNVEMDAEDITESVVTSASDIAPYYGLFAVIFVIIILIAMAVALCIAIFLTNILNVGLNKFFILNLFGKPEFKELFSGFSNGNYMKILKIMFKKTLYTFLWTLVFVIPGIIKSYEYYMVPYILAENPDIDEKTAFRLSKEMMKGNKWRTFVLSISFIGWEILCLFTFGLGYYFLMPYVYASNAALYEKLRMNISVDDREMYLNDEMFGFKRVETIETVDTVENEATEEGNEVNF